jgi:hypothetical protein
MSNCIVSPPFQFMYYITWVMVWGRRIKCLGWLVSNSFMGKNVTVVTDFRCLQAYSVRKYRVSQNISENGALVSQSRYELEVYQIIMFAKDHATKLLEKFLFPWPTYIVKQSGHHMYHEPFFCIFPQNMLTGFLQFFRMNGDYLPMQHYLVCVLKRGQCVFCKAWNGCLNIIHKN